MAGSTVTSTLDIRLIDDVSPAAAKVAASLKKMETEALELDAALGKSGTSDKMQANLKRLGASAPQIEGVAKAYADFAKAQGIALGSGAKLTADQTKAVKSWESTTIAGVRAVMATEKARDAAAVQSFEKTTALWRQETAAHAREVERQVADDRRAAEQRAQIHAREAQREERDRAREYAAEQRHHHQMAERQAHAAEHHGLVNYALSSAAMAVSAHEIGHVIGEAWHQGAELQHERIGLQNAGRTPEEIREIEHASRGVLASTPTAGMIENLKTVAETTAAFGSVEHAVNNLPFISKMTSILKTAGGENIHGDAAQLGQAFAKTFEERQTKAVDFEAEAKQMIPAMVATGGTFNPEQLYAFAQQAKSSLPSLSMRFLSRIAPSLIGAQGGDRAGTSLNAFESVVAGKVNDKKQAEEWLGLGLLDQSKLVMSKGHAVGWKSGAVKDTSMAMTDPLQWAETYLIPALKAKGVDTSNRESVQMILNTMFRNQNANMFATEIAQEASRQRLHKDEALYGKVGSFDEIYARNLQDFGVAAGALKTALGNLAGAATAPLMHATAESLSWLAGNLNKVAAFGYQHPTLAATAGVGTAAAALGSAGWLGMKLMDGFGLKGSAAALTGSAGAIDAAAGRLGMGGGFGGGGGAINKAENAAVNAAEGAGGGAALNRVVNGGVGRAGAIDMAPTAESVAPAVALEFGAAVVAGGIAVAVTEGVKQSFAAQEPGKGGLFAPITEESRDRDNPDLANLRIERDDLRAQIARSKAMEKIPGTSDAENYPRQQRAADLDRAIALKERSLVDLDAANSPEARAGRAFMAMRRPEEFGPTMPDGWSGRFGRVMSAEQFGPNMPNLPDTDRADRARASDLGGYTRDPWLSGDRPGIEERARRGAEFFRRDPEAARGQAMMQHSASIEAAPTVDTASIDAAGTRATEVGATMQTALNVTASPQVDTGSITAAGAAVDSLAAKLRSLGPLAAAAASAVAAASGGVPGAGAIRAASNRQFAGASQTG